MADFSKYIEIVKKQEEILRFENFTQNDALTLALIIIRKAKEEYKRDVSIRIDLNNVTVFYYLMGNASLGNDFWMKKKMNGVMKTGHASFMNHMLIEGPGNYDDYPWAKNEGMYACRGGCFPIFDLEGKIYGTIATSGMAQIDDHQLVVEALAEFSGKEVPTTRDGQMEFVP